MTVLWPYTLQPGPAASSRLTQAVLQRAKQRQIRCNAAGLSAPLSAAQPDRCSATAASSPAEQRECQAADLEQILKERGACGVRIAAARAARCRSASSVVAETGCAGWLHRPPQVPDQPQDCLRGELLGKEAVNLEFLQEAKLDGFSCSIRLGPSPGPTSNQLHEK